MLLILALACTSSTGEGPATDTDTAVDLAWASALQSALDEAHAEVGAPGVQAHVWQGDQRWTGVAGYADVDAGDPVRIDHVFRMASITKMFVGALAAELHVDGQLDLDLPVSTWVPSAPRADDYTLRDALHHVTGLPDYVEKGPLLIAMDQPWTPDELLALVEDDALHFEPGTAYEYANTNYLVAGLAIEAATDRTWQEQVRERFVDPLELPQVSFPTEEPVAGELVRGYAGDGGNVLLSDDVDPSIAWAVGEIVADAPDLAAACRALVRGDTLTPEAHALWLQERRLSDGTGTAYGLGVELEDHRVGHSGSILGFQSRVYVDRDGERTVVAAVNSFTTEADGIAEPLWAVD